MRLTDLSPELLAITDNGHKIVDDLASAQGICFQCPVCFQKNGGPAGTHYIICWFNGRGVPPDRTPGPGRWNPSGTGCADLTFVEPGATSILLNGGCNAHFHLVSGEIKFC